MPAIRLACAALVSALLVACVAPTPQTDAAMAEYDKDTQFAITPRADGFAIAVNYSKYQFIPESAAIAVECKSAITAIAYEHAEKQGRKLLPLNEQRIRISLGRNTFTGVTSCSALAIAQWQP